MNRILFIKTLSIVLLVTIAANINSYADSSEQEMDIQGIGFDQNVQTPVVLLKDKELGRIMPIWIGLCEARSIELSISNVVPPRPLTYDLIAAMVRTMNAKVDRIVVVDLRDEVFYAQVEVSVDGKKSIIDARPSDAIALASRMNSPIYVKKSVLEKAALLDPGQEKRGL